MYDVTKQQTFDNLKGWLQEVSTAVNSPAHIPILLIGNKCDLVGRRVVPTEVGQKFATEHRLLYTEASVKNDENLERTCLYEFTRKMIEVSLNAKHR